MELIWIGILGAVLCGVVAQVRGRFGFGWFLLGLFGWPIFLILVLCLPSPKARAAERAAEQARRDLEQKRHMELLAVLAGNRSAA